MNLRPCILAVGLTACVDHTSETTAEAPVTTELPEISETPETPETPEEPDTPGVSGDDIGEGELSPEEAAPARDVKRMSVDQIKASMEQVSGGIVWKRRYSRTPDWDRYASTLGVPDFQRSTQEDRSPGVMFQKFLDDAANHTCAAWVGGETDGFFVEADVDEADPERVRANIAHLRWRIQGHAFDTDAPIVDRYESLYDRVVLRTNDRASAWTTVCIAMFSHPDFYAY